MQIKRQESFLKAIKMLSTTYKYRIVYMGLFVMGCSQRKFKTHKGFQHRFKGGHHCCKSVIH